MVHLSMTEPNNSSLIIGIGAHDYKSSSALSTFHHFPKPKSESSNGRYQCSNGMSRVHRILTPEEVAAGRKTRWMELEITGTIRNLSPNIWSLRHLTALFLNKNQLSRIPPEISLLCNLTMLDLSHNKLRSLPAELGDMISLCHLYLNYNQIRVLPYEIGKLFRLGNLGLHGNPLNAEISKIYHEPNGTQKLLQFLLDHLAINTHAPPDRQWVTVRRIDRERPTATLTVMCYNVLCDKYATTNLYSYCPTWALNWEYRKSAIMKEIRQYEADIITLQEVETEQYWALFLPELEKIGYSGIFSPKSRAKTMGEDERKYVDGCAIFWKTDKFEFEKEHLLEFTQVAISKAEGSEHMINRVMPRDNIALCAVLKMKDAVYSNSNSMMAPPPQENVSGNPIVICTAHIHWDPEFCDVKLVQTMMLTHELSKLLEEVARLHRLTAQHVPTLICGDLNSLPDSGVYEFLTKGVISSSHYDLKGFRNENSCLQKLSSSNELHSYSHNLKLEPAYDTAIMPFTNYTLDFKGIIDYILSTPNLVRLGVLGPLDLQWFQQNKILGCPHPHVPSDHIPLLAQYAILPPNPQQQSTAPLTGLGGGGLGRYSFGPHSMSLGR